MSSAHLKQEDLKKTTNGFLAKLVQFVFYGNYFYGICVVILSIEASIQQGFGLNHWSFYVLIGCTSTAFYIIPYIRKPTADNGNQRVQWYNEHQLTLKFSLFGFIAAGLTSGLIFLVKCLDGVVQIYWYELLLLIIFPLSAVFYYGIDVGPFKRINLRRTGWLKPFVIGFVWAGWVTVYPIIFYGLEYGEHFIPTFRGCLLTLKNFMFISMLGIMFDIKDYADDKRLQLPTVVVRTGLKRTLFYIIIPVTILGMGTFLSYAVTHYFHLGKILLNTIPFLLLIVLAYSLKQQKSVLFYFVLVDGLIMVKGICGIIAMVYF